MVERICGTDTGILCKTLMKNPLAVHGGMKNTNATGSAFLRISLMGIFRCEIFYNLPLYDFFTLIFSCLDKNNYLFKHIS